MDLSAYQAIVRDALDALPSRLREELKDVAIVIEARPEDRPDGNPLKDGRLLLGLYEGTPLTSWGRDYSGKLPDKITIFLEPILRIARSEEEIPHIIRETVWHEVGHYFGLDHTQIRKMEERWRKGRKLLDSSL
ncbi:MAG: metallopeptidase family protein [Candidatus Peribacteraceae bacterium]